MHLFSGYVPSLCLRNTVYCNAGISKFTRKKKRGLLHKSLWRCNISISVIHVDLHHTASVRHM